MQVNSTWIEIQIHNRYANGTRILGSKSLVCMLTSARGPFLWSEYMHSVVYNRCVCFLVCDCVCVCVEECVHSCHALLQNVISLRLGAANKHY